MGRSVVFTSMVLRSNFLLRWTVNRSEIAPRFLAADRYLSLVQVAKSPRTRMEFILRLKHWQVFLILLTGSITSNFTWENNELSNLVLNSFGLIIYFFWYFAVGLELTEHLPKRVEFPRTLFIMNAFVLIISMLIIVAVFDGQFSSNVSPRR